MYSLTPSSDSPTPYLWGLSLPTVSIVEEEGLEVGVPQLTLDLIPCQYFPIIHHCVQVRCHETHPACAWTLRDCGANRSARAVTGILWAGGGVSVTEAGLRIRKGGDWRLCETQAGLACSSGASKFLTPFPSSARLSWSLTFS